MGSFWLLGDFDQVRVLVALTVNSWDKVLKGTAVERDSS